MKSLSLENAKLLYNEKAIDGLHEINFEVKQGEILGLMGPSGCGKSTLAKVIAGKLGLSSGHLNHNFDHIFYLEESLLDDSQTVLENFVSYAHGDTQNQKVTRARMACSDLEITNYINSSVSDLSTGQKQRVLLGLALVSQSDLIILDEPFSHLEAPLKRELIDIILPLFKEIDSTLIWISHDQQLILQYTQRVALMNYGKIVQCSDPQTLYFHPKNMFALDFFGEANKEFLVDGKSNIWGHHFSNNENNPMLVYRAQAISINQNPSGDTFRLKVDAKLISSFFDGISFLNEFKVSNNILWVRTLLPVKNLQGSYILGLDLELVNIIG